MWKCSAIVLLLIILPDKSEPKIHRKWNKSLNAKEFHTMSIQKLKILRALMQNQPSPLAAYIVPTADSHNSEYIASADARREWITGFTGSAGTAVITSSSALMWTDGRYYTQFEKEVDTTLWTLMKSSLPDTPNIEKYLTSTLSAGSVVGVDPYTFTRDEWTPLLSALTKANMTLIPVDQNLIDEARLQLGDPPPNRPNNAIIPLNIKYTGKSADKKIAELRAKMNERKTAALVITALDEIAYTLNLRGSDIEYNPVFFAYLVITPSSLTLFRDGKTSNEAIAHLKSENVCDIDIQPYKKIVPYLHSLANDLTSTGDGVRSVWLSSDASEAIHRAAAGVDVVKNPLTLISEVSPVQLMKLIKNDQELEGFRRCHIRDGIAVVRLFKWLHDQINANKAVTEIQAADKLLHYRNDEAEFMGPSFSTIAGAGANGAIIHYCPSRNGTQKVIEKNDMFLLDSGGQYKDGTTDVTRTRHMSNNANNEQKAAFTRVLKGQIMVSTALFPQGVKGNVLDSFARHALWEVGLDYAHGTGHGVGHFLNVHEGPSGVSWRPFPHDPGLKPGQILSNEPGYYKVGEYGIRHEDLVETVSIDQNSDHPRATGLIGDFDGRGILGFNTLTLVPHQKSSIDIEMLTDFEISYINDYHYRILATLGPLLNERKLTEDLKWLQSECSPIKRCVRY